MKVLVILTIILSSLLFPTLAFAQTTTGTCNSSSGFVEWQKCLSGSKDGGGGVTITEPVFINNAYEKFYKESLTKCNVTINSPIYLINLPGGQQIENCKSISSTLVLNKFALDIFTILLGVMFLIFSFLIFRSRIMYITAGDNEDQVKKSKKIATAAFVGFLFIFFGLIFGQILAASIGSSLFDIKLFG